QHLAGGIPLLHFIAAITDLQQGIRKLARLRILIDDTLKGSLRFGKGPVDVIGFAQPILAVIGERTIWISGHELLKRGDRFVVLTVLEQIEGRLIGRFILATRVRWTCSRESIRSR